MSAVLGPTEPPILSTATESKSTATRAASENLTAEPPAINPTRPAARSRTIRITHTTDLGPPLRTRAGRRGTACHDLLLSDTLYYAWKFEPLLARPAVLIDAMD